MNSSLMASCVAADRDIPAFDFSIGNPVQNDSATSAASSASVGLTARRGLMSMMKGMVGLRDQDSATGAARIASSKVISSKLDAKSYAARWRTTKLVIFELVRGNIPITTTNTSTASTAAGALNTTDSIAGNALYRIKRNTTERRKSVIGDKLKKLRALQNGVVRKIAWLPEWWWDLLPPIDLSSDLEGFTENRMSDLLDFGDDNFADGFCAGERLLSECTILDEAEDPFKTDAHLVQTGGPRYDAWRWLTDWDDCDWMPNDLVSFVQYQILLKPGN